ncbi:MAG TPA: ABC transporter substrate-binding protein [Stellaceae bacterium]|jgi:ABC-type nitrate/sulfonate/bicarbonate transport system substrate-binding protein
MSEGNRRAALFGACRYERRRERAKGEPIVTTKFRWGAPLAVIGLAACLSPGLGVGSAAADATVRVGKAIALPFDFTPLDVGMAKGFYKKHGLDIEEINFAGSAKLQQGLAADAVDIGLGSGPELAFVAKGNTDLGVAAFAGPANGLLLIVRPDAGIDGPAGLKGKRIGVSTVGGLTDWMVHQVSVKQGWGPDGIRNTALGTDEAQIAALRTKDLDGMCIDVAGAYTLQEAGAAKIVLNFGSIVPDFINHITYASNKFIAGHPDELREFLAGWFETVAWMRKNKDETVKIAAPVMHKTPEIAARAYDVVMPSLSDTGKFDPKALKVLANSFIDMKLLDHAPDMSKLYTEKFLPSAPATN